MSVETITKVAIATLGCKVNQFETADMIEQFKKAGWELVPFSHQADLYVINTCTVTSRSDSESRRLIRRARRLNPLARIVATGCYAQVSPTELAALPELDQVLGNEEKIEIVAKIADGANHVTTLTDLTKSGPLRLTSHTEHTRAFLQVQNGCEQGCSYCIVPFARGPNRSVPLDEVREAVQRLARVGFREVVLTGIHLGAYGLDQQPASSLTDLVRLLDHDGAVERIRLGSIEPNELTDELLELIAHSDRVCHHLHLPLQSGSSSVLARMRRGYDADLYRRVVERSLQRLPDAFVAADLIAGFPGESESEFEETCALIEQLTLADLHVFPYSRRPGTPAASLADQVKPALISERAERLRSLATKKRQAFMQRQIGARLQVLGLRYAAATGTVQGLSRNYLEVCYRGTGGHLNREVDLIITGIENGRLLGEEPPAPACIL